MVDFEPTSSTHGHNTGVNSSVGSESLKCNHLFKIHGQNLAVPRVSAGVKEDGPAERVVLRVSYSPLMRWSGLSFHCTVRVAGGAHWRSWILSSHIGQQDLRCVLVDHRVSIMCDSVRTITINGGIHFFVPFNMFLEGQLPPTCPKAIGEP